MFPGAVAEAADAAYAIIGAPLDATTSFRPGTRFGPRQLRHVAESFEDYDHRTDSSFTDCSVHDHGDIRPGDDVAEYLDFLQGTVDEYATDGATPLLVGGSVVLALLEYAGANAFINTVLTPITAWWLGVPVALGVPMLFGILRKELSLVMVYQALGTFDISQYMNWIQIATFLIFITFYVPCIATFAAMIKTVGRRYAFYSAGLSVLVALAAGGVTRWLLTAGAYPVL
jgi:hypothetical protein